MNDQAMTKLASEFYERGRQAALIETGLVKVANKKKTLQALLAGLGIGGSAGVGASSVLKTLRKAGTKVDDVAPPTFTSGTLAAATPSQEAAAARAIEAFAPERLSMLSGRGSRLGDALPEAVRGGAARQMARAEQAIADYASRTGAGNVEDFLRARAAEVSGGGSDYLSKAVQGLAEMGGLR
jgi:hypothetical protein